MILKQISVGIKDRGKIRTVLRSNRPSFSLVSESKSFRNHYAVGLPIPFAIMLVLLVFEALSEEVSYMSSAGQDHVTDIGRLEVEVGRFIYDMLGRDPPLC